MRVSAMRSLLCFAAAVTVASAAHGQEAVSREGLWLSGGLGMGSMGCATCTGRATSLTGDVVVGGALGQMFLIGGGITFWTKTGNGTIALFDFVVRLYASPRSGLYFALGGGGGLVSASVSGTGPSGSEFGAGLLIGMGYDIRIARTLSLTPYWQIIGAKTENLDVNVGHVGLNVTIH